MREISTQTIVDAVKDASIRANLELGDDVVQALESALEYEESNVGKDILQKLLENAKIAREERIPMCQDTGVAVLFVELGKGVSVKEGDLYQALEEGIRQGYKEGFLRKSVCHPYNKLPDGPVCAKIT